MSAMFATRRRRGWTLFGVLVLVAVLLALRQLTGEATSAANSARVETRSMSGA